MNVGSWVSIVLVTAYAAQQASVQPRPILLVGGTLIDGSGAAPRPNDAILIDGGRIRGLGAQVLEHAPKTAL